MALHLKRRAKALTYLNGTMTPKLEHLGVRCPVMSPNILVATWSDGVLTSTGNTVHRELAGQSVIGLAPDGQGAALVIVDKHSLRRRAADGAWQTIANSESDLSCCVAAKGVLYVGTDDARVLRVTANGELEPLEAFDVMSGREKWYAGTALVDGRVLGPPLGIRSMSATSDGALLANVHVGGIPRSVDGGRTWQPTIDIESDVHEVCAHPTAPNLVIAAAAVGLCISRDGGSTWIVEHQGLHALHCSAVAFAGNDMLVSAATDPFAAEGAVYRRAIDGDGPLLPLGEGLPRWLDGGVDTGSIAARGSAVAIADRTGNLHVSEDAGRSWARSSNMFPGASSVFIY
jgi:hypothetical protein